MDYKLINFILFIILIFLVMGMVAQAHGQSYVKFIKEKHPSSITNKRATNLSRYINHYSDYYNVPTKIVVAVIWQENNFVNKESDVDFNPPSGGYMQITTTTAEDLLGRPITLNKLILNWTLNIELGINYLREQYDKTKHWAGAIGRYNGVHNLDYVNETLDKVEVVEKYQETGEVFSLTEVN